MGRIERIWGSKPSATRSCPRSSPSASWNSWKLMPRPHRASDSIAPASETPRASAIDFTNISRGEKRRRAEFDEVLELVADGIRTGRGPRGAYVHHDEVNKEVRGRKNARLAAVTS